MTDSVFEPLSKARPANTPPICIAENLPSFATQQEAKAWAENWGSALIHVWLCKECLHWHEWSVGADPGGQTSGTTRTQKHVETLRDEFFSKHPHLKER